MPANNGGAPYGAPVKPRPPRKQRSPYEPVPAYDQSGSNQSRQPTTPRKVRPKAPPKPKVDWGALAADPATRPKVPDRILRRVNPEAFKQRQQNRFNAAPVTPGSSMTNRELGRVTDAAVGEKYGYADEQMRQQYEHSRATEQQIPGWFDYYRQQVQDLAAADATARQAATGQIAGLGGTLAAAASRAATADQTAMAQDAAIRGAALDPQAAVRAQQAAQINTADLGTLAALQVGLGANQGTYWRGQEGVSEQAKVQRLLEELAYRRTLDKDAEQLAREKGDFATTYRTGRIDSEHTKAMERAAFGLKKADAAADAANATRQERRERQKYRTDFMAKHGVPPDVYRAMTPEQRAQNDRLWAKQSKPKDKPKVEKPSTIADPPSNFTGSEANWNAMSRRQRNRWVKNHPTSKPAAPKSRLTPAQQETYRSQITTIADYFMNPPRVTKDIGIALGLDPSRAGSRLTAGEVIEYVRRGESPLGNGVPPEIINAGRSLASNNGRGLGPWGIHNARRAGVKVRGNFRRLPAKPKRKPKGSGAFEGATAQGTVG